MKARTREIGGAGGAYTRRTSRVDSHAYAAFICARRGLYGRNFYSARNFYANFFPKKQLFCAYRNYRLGVRFTTTLAQAFVISRTYWYQKQKKEQNKRTQTHTM